MPNENPILNNPYREPELHYATNLEGELDYQATVKGRRLFSGTVQTIPVQQRGQRDLLEINDVLATSHGEHLVNVLRREVKAWRDGGYLDTLADVQIQDNTEPARQNFSLRLETRLIRGKDTQTMAFRWTDDPSAPAVALREEDVLKTYPWTYRILTDNLRKRYSDFFENNSYHAIRKPLENNKKLVLTRSLNPDNPISSKQRFYSPNIVN